MKFKYILSAITACVTALSLTVSAYQLSEIGDVYYKTQDIVSPGLVFSELHAHDGNDFQHAFTFEYTPGLGTLPIVSYGSEINSTSTLGSMINQKINEGTEIVGGVNGDFYSFYTGVPMSAVILDGKIISSCDSRPAIGFYANGTAIIGYPSIDISVLHGSDQLKIDHLNKYPSVYSVYMLTSAYGETTSTEKDSLEIVLQLSSDEFKGNSSVIASVKEIRRDSTDSEIPEGCAVIVVHSTNPKYEDFAKLAIGDKLTVSFSIDSDWSNVVTAVGGSDIILKNGVFDPATVNEQHEKYANPRTSAGITADGRVIFFAIDGRNAGYSKGLTLEELAKVMADLGCITALNLDGGGSTTVAVKKSGTDAITIINNPSDGSQRRLSNAVLFANSVRASGIPDYIKITPPSPYVLTGCEVMLDTVLYDTSARVLDLPYDVTYSITSGNGKVSSLGRFTASDQPGTVTVSASANVNGIVYTASTDIRVFTPSELTNIQISSKFNQIPFGATTQLSVTGYYMTAPVYASPKYFSWELDSDNSSLTSEHLAESADGYIGSDGMFYASQGLVGKELTIKASYGDISDSVTIGIGLISDMIQNFELKPSVFSTKRTDIEYISGGYKSDTAIKFTGESLDYIDAKTLTYSAQSLKLWCYKDIGNSNLFVNITDADGIDHKLLWIVDEDYSKVSGWILLSADIPKNIAQPITINSILTAEEEHTFIIDSFYSYYGNSNTVFTDLTDHWAVDYVNSAYNMGIVDGEYTPDKGIRVYSPARNLSRSEFAKLIACFCNLDIESYSELSLPYSDISSIPEWAIPYVKAVTGSGIMGAKPDTAGNIFAGKEEISRAEVMHIIGGLLTPLDGYSDIEFTDANDIPTWAIENTKITVSCGIILGYEDNSVRPHNKITRAEIATVFSRLCNSNYYQP